MTNQSDQSYIDFGTPDASIIGDGSEIFWLSKDDPYSPWWTNEVRGMKWKDVMNDTYETTFTPTEAITDTGSSCLIGPSEYVDIIYNSILAQTSVSVEDPSWGDIYWCSDIPNLPSFYLNFGGYWFEVKAEDYSIEVATDICAMCITAVEGYDEWILGDTFMRGWYNIHDHAN